MKENSAAFSIGKS